MPTTHFTVSQVRVAASCPRIFTFDADLTRRQGLKAPSVTRIWKSGDGETTACGTLFHATIEQFNNQAAAALRGLLNAAADPETFRGELIKHVYWNHLNRDALFEKTGPQQQAFMTALRVYLSELADILAYALKLGKPRDEILGELFGDRRRRVDVTFPVGPVGAPVRVTGVLDYVFYDWRSAHHRILDYKLTPALQPANDLFQVCVYALMHHTMYHTESDVGVLYLHPQRRMIEKAWADIWAERDKVFNLLASMHAWAAYDEQTGRGLKPPGEPVYCEVCRWNAECVARLGPKHEGQRLASQGRETQETCVTHPPATSVPDSPNGSTDALWLGAALDGAEPVSLPQAALPTHVAVVGAAGSGKTWLAKVLVEEAVLAGIPVLAIDPQGDLVQFLRPADPADLGEAERQGFDRFHGLVEPRVLTPGSSHGIRVSLNPMRLPSAQDLASLDPARRAEELEGMLHTAAGNLVGLAKAGGEVDSQRVFLFQVLKAVGTSGMLTLEDVTAAVAEPERAGIDNPERFVKKSERDKLGRKLNNLLYGPSANLFTGGTPFDLDRLRKPGKAGNVPLNVVYLNALRDDDQKQFFVAALAAEIYRWMVTSAASGPARLLFYLDEARDYVPAGAQKPPAKEPLLRLFAQGRKYGVACLVCTQSPRSVDYNVFGNCSTKLIGRLESAQDVERVAEWFAATGPAPSWLRGRQGADRGTFVGRWPAMPAEWEGRTFRSRRLYSLHGGAWSPERVQEEASRVSGLSGPGS